MATNSKKQTVVAIGGGELKDLDTLPIDKEIIKVVWQKEIVSIVYPYSQWSWIGYR